MTESLPWPWPPEYTPPREVTVVYRRADGEIGQVVGTRSDKVSAHAAMAAEDGCSIIVLPPNTTVTRRAHRVDNGRIVERDEPLLTEQERREKAVREAAGVPDGTSITEHRLAALERAIAGLDIPEADEVRRIRAALDAAERDTTTPDSQERETR